MQTFKKTLFSVLCFVCCLSLLSVFLIVPFLRSENNVTKGRQYREQLVGELDFLISGSSHALTAFDPKIIDSKLGCTSYNLANASMSLYGRKALLEKELERNEIDTVVIELSYNALAIEQGEDAAAGDQTTMARLDSFQDRVKYMFEYLPVNEWANIYSRDLEGGVLFWLGRVLGKPEAEVEDIHKGFAGRPTVDCTLASEKAAEAYNSKLVPTDYLQENIDQIIETVELCKARNAKVIIAVTPVSDAFIWENDGWEFFSRWVSDFCKEHDCNFYDFNLLKNRYELFSDSESYYDKVHMSAAGSEQFSTVFCDIVSKANAGEDVSAYFFDSYEELNQLSPYVAYLP